MKRWPGRSEATLRQRAASGLAAVAIALGAVGCEGCSPTYVLRGAWEEARILARREPIADVLDGGGLTVDQRRRLALVPEVRRYASDVLGFDVGDAYASYAEVPPGALVWVVSAAEKTRLRARTWWFPIVGSVPYKGFFDAAEARALAARLEGEGWDTWVRPTQAFSTLGWFDDPVLSSWLARDRVDLADLVLHELVHRDLWIEGEAPFNESFATFVAGRATIDFFERRGRASPADEGTPAFRDRETVAAREAWQTTLEAASRLEQSVAALSRLYDAGERDEIGAAEVLRRRAVILRQLDPTGRTNNAVILARRDYLRDLAGFECALAAREGSFSQRLRQIAARARAASDPWSTLPQCSGSG